MTLKRCQKDAKMLPKTTLKWRHFGVILASFRRHFLQESGTLPGVMNPQIDAEACNNEGR